MEPGSNKKCRIPFTQKACFERVHTPMRTSELEEQELLSEGGVMKAIHHSS